jgi:general secretion pathway protein M
MMTWFAGLSTRERAMVGVAIGFVLVAVIWFAALQPLMERRALLERGIAAQESLLEWMQAQRPATANGSAASPGESLFALVDRSARATVLAESVQRIQPDGRDAVRVWLEAASFDALVSWIAQLDAAHGVGVTMLAVERAADEGRVSVRLTLERR